MGMLSYYTLQYGNDNLSLLPVQFLPNFKQAVAQTRNSLWIRRYYRKKEWLIILVPSKFK